MIQTKVTLMTVNKGGSEEKHQIHFDTQHPNLDAENYEVGSCPGGCVITKEDYPLLFRALGPHPLGRERYELPHFGK